jgi:histidine triad (HIT) family protein
MRNVNYCFGGVQDVSDCIFCKIAQGKAPADLVFQDDEVIAFRDISPAAPTHILVVPRQHIVNTSEVDDHSAPLVGRMVRVAAQIAREQGVEKSGYRLVMNTGPDGGQVVMHLHLHLLAGRRMRTLG